MDETQLQQIVSRVVAEVRAKERRPAAEGSGQAGVFPDVDSAVRAATVAFRQLQALPLALREKLIAAIRQTLREEARNLAWLAQSETGLGRVEDKVEKNLLVTNATPGPEILRPAVITGDHGLTLTELAPFGVIGAITPSTNPTATIINNTISMVSAGNAVVFNAHPAAKGCSARAVELINKAIASAGGPANLVACTAEPTIESAQELMRHPGIRLLVVTGGPAVVQAAMNSGKRAICAGPGNPPAVVDETADIPKAARDIVKGAGFDNNVVCTDEKEIIVVASVADALIGELKRNNVLLVGGHQLRQLEKALFATFPEPGCAGAMRKEFVGKNPSVLMREIGVTIGDDVRLLVADVPKDHPLVFRAGSPAHQAAFFELLDDVGRARTGDEDTVAQLTQRKRPLVIQHLEHGKLGHAEALPYQLRPNPPFKRLVRARQCDHQLQRCGPIGRCASSGLFRRLRHNS